MRLKLWRPVRKGGVMVPPPKLSTLNMGDLPTLWGVVLQLERRDGRSPPYHASTHSLLPSRLRFTNLAYISTEENAACERGPGID